MLRPKRGNRSNVENKGTIQSPFVKYCITVVSCTLICGVAFLFLMFGTDTIYQVNEDSIDTAQSFNRVSVSTVVDTIKQEDSSTGSISVPGLSGLTGIDYNSWYTDLSSITGDTSNPVEIGAVTAYRSIPWDSTGETFFYYSEKAKLDLYDYLSDKGLSAKRQGTREFVESNYMAYMNTVDRGKPTPTGSFSDTTKYCTRDGLNCIYIAPMPATCNKDYFSSGDWGVSSWTNIPDWDTTKFCIVVVPKGSDKKDSSNYIYIPAVAGSAKAHTYPWGVVQTNVSVKSPTRVEGYTRSGGDFGWGMDVSDVTIESEIVNIVNAYDDGAGNNIMDYLYCSLELCATSSSFRESLKSGYDMVGFVTFK